MIFYTHVISVGIQILYRDSKCPCLQLLRTEKMPFCVHEECLLWQTPHIATQTFRGLASARVRRGDRTLCRRTDTNDPPSPSLQMAVGRKAHRTWRSRCANWGHTRTLACWMICVSQPSSAFHWTDSLACYMGFLWCLGLFSACYVGFCV